MHRKLWGCSTSPCRLFSHFTNWFWNIEIKDWTLAPASSSVMWILLCWKWLKTCIYLLSKGLGLKIICLWLQTVKQQKYFTRKESMQLHYGKRTVPLQQESVTMEIQPLPTKASEKWLQVFQTFKQKQICSWTQFSSSLVTLNSISQCNIFAVALALYLDISILLVDLDIVFLQQPFPYLNCTDCDFIFQMNRPQIKQLNTGNIFTKYQCVCVCSQLWSPVQHSFHCFRFLLGSSNHKC